MYTNSINTSNALSGLGSSYNSPFVANAAQALTPVLARPADQGGMPEAVSCQQETNFYQNVIMALINVVMALVERCLPSYPNWQGETDFAAGEQSYAAQKPTAFSQLGDTLDSICGGVKSLVPWAKEAWSSLQNSCGGIVGLVSSLF